MATELAKAYVQIIPSAKGIKGSISNVLGGEAENAGSSAGISIASKIKSAIVTAGIGKAIGKALTEGASLQQSLGGIETLFKDSADKVIKNAEIAYKTAGISANEYMESVTSFSASLLQSLGNDTNKAADVADMALTDMSDNANKMGTSMESIQTAYQGFAKQNYTMLDNLKLGYGGTKTEMERLLADAQKITGVKYDISSLSDVYEAIHVIQDEMGITGTTAKEASETFSGSLASMKASFSDLLGNLALGENIGPSLKTLASTTYTFLVKNLLPMVGNIIKGIGGVIIGTDWMEVITEAVNNLINTIETKLPLFLQEGATIIASLVNGILSKIPDVVQSAGQLITNFLNSVMQKFPTILNTGAQLLINIVNGIIRNLPKIIESAVKVVAQLASTILKNAPQILQSGISLIGKLAAGLISAVPSLIKQIPSIITKIKNAFLNINWGEIGKNIISGIARGISNGVGAILNAAKNAAKSALNAAKKALGIHSPSKLFEEQVGKMIDMGLAAGIENNVGAVSDSMKELSKATVGMIDTNNVAISPNTIPISKASAVDDLFESVQIIVENHFSVDGTPLKEKISDYTIKRINDAQKDMLKMRGAYSG